MTDGFYRFPNYPRTWRNDEDREDVESNGVVTFNWLQQHPEGFDSPMPATPVEEAGTTDPHDVATISLP